MGTSSNLNDQRFEELMARFDEIDARIINELANNPHRRPEVLTRLDVMAARINELANNQRRPEVLTRLGETTALANNLQRGPEARGREAITRQLQGRQEAITRHLQERREALARHLQGRHEALARHLQRGPEAFNRHLQRGPEALTQRLLGTNPLRSLGTTPLRGLGTAPQRNPEIDPQGGSRAGERRIPRIVNISRGAIQDFFANELHTTPLAALGLVEMIEGTCSEVCKDYRRFRNQYHLQYWTAVPQNDKKEMLDAVLEDIMDEREDIENLLNRCVDLWPIEFFLQRQWPATI